MVAKTLMVASAVCAMAGLPVALPAVSGIPVTLSLGPVDVTFDRDKWIDLDLDPDCFIETCPIAQISFGDTAEPVRLTGR